MYRFSFTINLLHISTKIIFIISKTCSLNVLWWFPMWHIQSHEINLLSTCRKKVQLLYYPWIVNVWQIQAFQHTKLLVLILNLCQSSHYSRIFIMTKKINGCHFLDQVFLCQENLPKIKNFYIMCLSKCAYCWWFKIILFYKKSQTHVNESIFPIYFKNPSIFDHILLWFVKLSNSITNLWNITP